MKSNVRNITARNSLSPRAVLEATYPHILFDDALCYSLEKNIILGISGVKKEIPVLQKLCSLEKIRLLLDTLKENDAAYLDIEKAALINGKDTYPLGREVLAMIYNCISSFYDYGGSLNENGEHVINLKSPQIGPHFGVNLLLGDRSRLSSPLLTTPKSVVDEFGGGSFRGPASEQVLATRWDMDPKENGNPFNRQFYLLEGDKQIFFSHNVNENVAKATAIHKINHSEISYSTEDELEIKRTIYLRPQKKEEEPIALERQVVEIINRGNQSRNLSIVFTGVFGSANPGCQMVDVIYQTVINQVKIHKKEGHPIALSADYYPEYAKEYVRFVTLGEDGFDEYSYDVLNFLGNGSIEHPENLAFLGNELRCKGPSFFALKKRFSLGKGERITLICSTGLIPKQIDMDEAIESIFPCVYQKELSQIQKRFKEYAKPLFISTGDALLDVYLRGNLPFQVMYQTYVSRAFAQTQKGYREIGFREIQDLYASMYLLLKKGEGKLVESLLSNWICNVYEMGYANHNFFFAGKEPGMCSDDSLWLIGAISRYLIYGGDIKFLRKRFAIAGSKRHRSLWDTLKAIVNYSGKISIGKHGIPLLDKADWNDCLKIDDDCLDGPSKEKRYKTQLRTSKSFYGAPLESDLSESVMNGFLLVIALDEMMEMARLLHDEDYVLELTAMKKNLVRSLKENAYLNGYYARVLINRKDSAYSHVGTPGDGLSLDENIDGSLYLNSFSWSVLSKVASEEEIAAMLPLVDKYLKTPAGYKLCTPHDLKRCGSKEAATEEYFLGDRENGGVFKHATMMFALACIRASKWVKSEELKAKLNEDADFMLQIVYPFNVLKNPYKFKGNPRFCTQYVNSITEEHIGPILSGTATWLLLVMMEKYGLK